MSKFTKLCFIGFFLLITAFGAFAQETDDATLLTDKNFAGLKLRNVGPALMSGRIADIAFNPQDNNEWYVAVGSGGVWKTQNAGTTWKPIFDSQKSYSIGCVTIDSNNPHVVWVGTGENVGGRHVGFGDGIYRSQDGGDNWENMGLKESYHISKIVVHPKKSNIIWVAAQGLLWGKGGERGLYKSIDSGKTWKKVLGDEEWIGVTDIVVDPCDPEWLYAATWQRHRTVAAYMGGGPGSGIYRSTDGGETWEKLTKGLPKTNMGKIGLAISPQKPDVVYAVIELDRRTGGFYRSENRGASWEKQSNEVSGATGPHYYQELFPSPHRFDRIYLVDSHTKVSEDGGKTFRGIKNEYIHGDDHALAFRSDDPDYLLIGSDGGLYESLDLEKNWRFIDNLPITQFYKVALDDAEPFYNIYGGTQDNTSQGGPSRTDNVHGIRNADWTALPGGDGQQPATEPGNPAVVYSQSQEGDLIRIDRTTGESVFIQPQPEADEELERFNWDAPILVSPHSSTRVYFASYRVWRSENRGDSWTAVSGDLTRSQNRYVLPIMDQTWSWDSPWDVSAMSKYNTITSLSESPLQEGLIYAGTDDGLIQITEDGGRNWRKVEVSSLPGVPKTAFINDIKADLHDVNTVYIALDNHKFADFNPYLLKSDDRGKSWRSIKGNIPSPTLVWRLVQDHIKPNLLFTATEFGIYFTIDGGNHWVKLTGGVPTISFRDLAIQRRENDLVGASFGRGFFVFDDYSVLRNISEAQLKKEASLFPVRKALWYMEREILGSRLKGTQGAGLYTAPNPPFGAVFTYYLAEGLKTKKDIRQQKEKELIKSSKNVTVPSWDEVEAERRQPAPMIWLTVKDSDGNVVRRVKGPITKGFHRVAWDLCFPATSAIGEEEGQNDGEPSGVMAAPGDYTATLSKQVDGQATELSDPMPFIVEPMRKGALKGADPIETAEFWQKIAGTQRVLTATSMSLSDTLKRVAILHTAISRSTTAPGDLDLELYKIKQALLDIDEQLNGNYSQRQAGDRKKPTIGNRLGVAMQGTMSSTYGPTPTHKRSLEIAESQLDDMKTQLENIRNERLPKLEKALKDAGAPYIKGQRI